MQDNYKKSFQYTSLAMGLLEKIFDPKLKIDGLENIPQKPVLFVANHFTRFETFIIPYILYKRTGRQIRCLGDSRLFSGLFGKFLTNNGAISVKDPKRNIIMTSDLICGKYDWMIYPEGGMIKGKEINHEGTFISHTPYRVGRTRTGAAILALKSELYRRDLIKAYKRGDRETINKYQKKYFGEKNNDLKKLQNINTHIVPVNITYHPIRPGNNIIKKFADTFFKELPTRLSEELEIEGNLLLSANINISFGKAINIGSYTKITRNLVQKIPIIDNKTKIDLILKYLKYRLTYRFMTRIYSDVKINIDHLFTAILYQYQKNIINIAHLKRLIYLCAFMIQKSGKYRISPMIEENNLYKILIDEPYEEFESIIQLAKNLLIIKESKNGKDYIIDNHKLYKKHDFHQIRLENTLQVIVNEFLLLKTANNIIKNNISINENKIKQITFDTIFKNDLKNFKNDYKKYYDAKLSKPKNIGSPFFLDNNKNDKLNNNIGIVISHGLPAAPKEVEKLANYLNNLGFKIYAIRLKGLGTAPRNIEDISWQDWYDSFQRGYAALSTSCSKIIAIGFSSGGLISLLSCANKKSNNIVATISINAAISLQDITSKFRPEVKFWSDLLKKFKIGKENKLEYVENSSENPHINYLQLYLNAIKQLGMLIDECADNLKNISTPTLIIHSKNDPVVKLKSGEIIFKKIKSNIKELIKLDMNNHVIITGENRQKVFTEIELFLNKLNLTG